MKKVKINKERIIEIGFVLIFLVMMCIDLSMRINTIKIGVVRGDRDESSNSELRVELQEHLQEVYGDVQVSLHYYGDASALFKALEQDGIQLGFVSGVEYALYGEDSKVIAAENVIEYGGEKYPYYTAILLEKSNEDEFYFKKDISSLQYCVFEPTSLVGYIFIRPYFDEQGMSFANMSNVSVIDSYDVSIESLANGTCDVSVGYMGILEDYSEIWGLLTEEASDIYEDLRIVYVSDKIYSSSVVVSSSLEHNRVTYDILRYLYSKDYSNSKSSDYTIMREQIWKVLGNT
ncbi:MAG: PhnD/SsuA/transferrin family substrate-binding protein [Erysipelotrichales bacterium]|nr:PhnD/SsuA/transferrin family substrate-binding protein [Erysipelotrichales bacterium]